MDANKEKWALVYGRILKDILDFYTIDSFILLRTSKQKDVLRHWLAGDRFPPNEDRNNICEVLRKHIPDKIDSTLNKQMTDIIKNKYIERQEY